MFHYDVLKKKYVDNIQLHFTDLDSLMYELCTEDFYDATNNKVVGKFKDEASGPSITEFVGLKLKMDSYQTLN